MTKKNKEKINLNDIYKKENTICLYYYITPIYILIFGN